MKKLVAILSLILIITNAFSQKKFQPGFIEIDSVKTYGLVKKQEDIASSMVCYFKNNENSETFKYKPDEIDGYGFDNGKYYLSKFVENDGLTIKLFLEYLIDGIIDIYYFRDTAGDHYFIENEKGEFIKLNGDKEFVYVNEVMYQKTDKSYTGILKYCMMNDTAIMNEIDEVNLSHKDLINITKKHHENVCSDYNCIVYEKQIPEPDFYFGPEIGFLLFSPKNIFIPVDKSGNYHEYLPYRTYDLDFTNYKHFISGLTFGINYPLFDENLYFQYSAMFSKIDINAVIHDNFEYGNMTWGEIFIFRNTYYSLNHSLGFKYNIFNTKITPYLKVGVSINQNIKTVYHDLNYEFTFFNGFYTGLSFGSGISFKTFSQQRMFVNILYNQSYKSFQYFSSKEFGFSLGYSF